MGVMVTLDLHVKPELLEEFLAFMSTTLPGTRSFDGCEGIETFVDLDAPGHVILVERWAERADHERYLAWREEQGTTAQLMPFIAKLEGGFHYFEPRPDV